MMPSGPAVGSTSALVRRITAVAGLFFVVCLVGTVVASGIVPGTDSTGEVVELYVIRHYHAEQASLVLGALAALGFLIFSGHLHGRLRRADAVAGDSWSATFLAGAIGTTILELAGEAAQGTYQELAHSGALPVQVLEVFHLANGLISASGIPLAVALVAVGMSGILNGTIAVPLSWLALATALVSLVSAGGVGTARTSFGTLNQIATVLLLLWVLAVSLWLLAGVHADTDGPAAGRARP